MTLGALLKELAFEDFDGVSEEDVQLMLRHAVALAAPGFRVEEEELTPAQEACVRGVWGQRMREKRGIGERTLELISRN